MRICKWFIHMVLSVEFLKSHFAFLVVDVIDLQVMFTKILCLYKGQDPCSFLLVTCKTLVWKIVDGWYYFSCKRFGLNKLGKVGCFIVVLYIVNKSGYLTLWKIQYFFRDLPFFKRVFLGPIKQWRSDIRVLNSLYDMFLNGICSFLESLVPVVNWFLEFSCKIPTVYLISIWWMSSRCEFNSYFSDILSYATERAEHDG